MVARGNSSDLDAVGTAEPTWSDDQTTTFYDAAALHLGRGPHGDFARRVQTLAPPASQANAHVSTLRGVQPVSAATTSGLPPSHAGAFDVDPWAKALRRRPSPWSSTPFIVVATGLALTGALMYALPYLGLSSHEPQQPVASQQPIASASQPLAAAPATPLDEVELPLPGATSDELDNGAGMSRKELRSQRLKARREAARERRAAAKQARLEARRARMETWQAKREARLASSSQERQERHAAYLARREEIAEARKERREAYLARREEARERRQAALLARREARRSRREGSGDDIGAGLAEAGSGTLRVNSRPWSEVYVDDRKIGHTPQLAINLAAGRHMLRLVNANFGVTRTFAVDIRSGETLTKVELLDD
jgi:hypothetical protein